MHPALPLFSILAIGSSASLESITRSLPDLQAPPQGEARWIARSMRMNGLPMTIKAIRSPHPPDEVLHYYEGLSQAAGGRQTRRTKSGPWHMLAIGTSQHHISIQVRSVIGGSEGAITVSSRPERERSALDTEFPLPRSATIVALQEYVDFGRRTELIALTSPRSVASEAQAVRHALSSSGWRLIRDGRGVETRRTRVIEAQKGAELALLTILPDEVQRGGAAIVIVWSKE
ncbi:MAG TPA: hypothetical protein VK025_10565 [Steroidobacter sp.]|nr:hypothetical protein [Steroidobacter sp.]